MKLHIKATGHAPDNYTINGETVNDFDLSVIEEGGKFVGNDDTRAAGIRDAWRDEQGTLHVVICQRVIASQYPGKRADWRGDGDIVDEQPLSVVVDSTEYDPDTCYVIPTGMEGINDYEIVQGTDAAGVTGWTVRKVNHVDA